jgi:hypothetical protein
MATIKNIRIDKMRYQKNKIAYTFVLVAMVFQTISLFMTITPSTVVPSFTTAVEILINITLLLFSFLAAEKVKSYSKTWSYGLFALSVVHLFRFFYEPSKLLRLGQISLRQYFMITTLIEVTMVLLIVAAIITLRKHRALMAHLKELGE